MAIPINFENGMGVSSLHEEGLHGNGLRSSWLYGGVFYAIGHLSSSWYSRERVLNSFSYGSLFSDGCVWFVCSVG